MSQLERSEPDFGAGRKKFGIYLGGLISCAVLTLIAFGVVMYPYFSSQAIFVIIYTAALVQFLVQVICFLRLTTVTEQGMNNVLSFLFTLVILIAVIAGSWWIMWSLNYYMTG